MRATKIIQLICWALVAVILLCVLLFSIFRFSSGRDLISFPRFHVNLGGWDGFDFDDDAAGADEGSGRYSTDNTYSVSANGIKNIEIDWISGNISVVPYGGEAITIKEESRQALENNEKLVYNVSGDTLYIKVWNERKGWFFGGFDQSKDLTVQLPSHLAKALGDLRVNAVSADILLNGLTMKVGDFETISGKVTVEDITSDELNSSSTSGDINITGEVREIDINTISGSIDVFDKICPDKVKIDTVSGDADLSIPENDGFQVSFDKVSGDFECEFPITTAKNGGTYKNGGAEFKMSTVSGDLDLRKNPS